MICSTKLQNEVILMDPRNPDDSDNKQIADEAGRVSQAIKIGEVVAHAAHVMMPPVVKAIGKGADIVAEAAEDPSSNNGSEKLICSIASVCVKGVIGTPFVSGAFAAGAAGGPVGSAMAAASVAAIVNKAAKPVGRAVQAACHAGFDRLYGREKASICIADALHREISNKNSALTTSIVTMAHSGQTVQQFMLPAAKAFLMQDDSTSQTKRSVTPLLASALGVNAGTAIVQLGKTTKAPIPTPSNVVTKMSTLAYAMANISTKVIDKNIENSAYLKEWTTEAARDFYKSVTKKIQLAGENKAEEVFDEELKSYTSTSIKRFSDQGLSVDELLIFGRAIQKSLADTWPQFVAKKIPRNSNTAINPSDVLGDLKRIKTRVEKADLHKQVRESVSTVNSNEQDMDRLLIDLLADSDISGFEHIHEIQLLKSELDAHKQSSDSTQFDILQAAQKLNVAKARVAEEEKRKDEYIKNARYCVDIASNAAYLLGNNKCAQQISVVGNALIDVSSVIASIGTMNPLAAASSLLGACASIKSLFSRHKGQNGNKMILDALRALGEQLQNLQKEMHERFNQVMDTLDDMNRNMVRGFLALNWKADNIIEQIQALHVEIDHLAERQANTGATVIEQLASLQRTIEHKSQVEEVTKLFTLTEKAIRDSNFQSKYSDYVTEVETHAVASNVGAKHMHIVGSSAVTREKDLPAFLKLVTENHLQHRSGYFALNTLLSYFEGLNFESDYHYQPENLDYLVDYVTKDNQDLACVPALRLSNLLIDEPELKDSPGTHVISLVKTLNEFEHSDAVIQLIPIQSNGTWHLLVVDTRHETFHYYGIADQLTINRLFAALDTVQKYEHWQKQMHVTCFEKGLGPESSALLVVKQCGEIAKQKTFPDISFTLTHAEAIQLHKQSKEVLRTDNRYPQTHTIPAHPMVWQYLSHALNYLVLKQYPDIQNASLSTDEIARFQRFIDEGNHIQIQLQRLRNPEFIRLLIQNYEEAARVLSEALDAERVQFEQKVSQKMASGSKLVLGESLFDLCSLKLQDIHVSTDYATKENGGKWFYTTSTETNRRKGVTLHLVGLNQVDDRGLGNDIRAEYKASYKTARENDIKNKKNVYMDYVDQGKQKELYYCEVDLYTGLKNCSKHLPAMLVPMIEGLPVLPMAGSQQYLSLIPDTYYHAQMMGLGQIKCAYQLIGDQFVLSSHFIQPHQIPSEQNKISSISIPYNPSFYKSPEAVWWWWVGGNYCDNLQKVSVTAIPRGRYSAGYANPHNVWMDKTIAEPICTEHQGLSHAITPYINSVQFHNLNMQQQIDAQMKDIMRNLRAEWYAELRRTMASDHVSSFGRAVATFEACSTLLLLVSEITLADKNQLDIFTQLMNQHPQLAFNQHGFDTLLTTSPENNITTMIAPKTQTTDLLANALSFLQKMRWKIDFPLDSYVIVELLQCMDNYVPNMRMGLSISKIVALQEQILEVDNMVLGAACQNLRAINIADSAERHKRDKLVAKLEYYQGAQFQMRAKIADSTPNLLLIKNAPEKLLTYQETSPAVTGYVQPDLMRNRTSPSELTKFSVAMGIDESLPFKLTGFSIAQTDHRWTEGTIASLTIPTTQDNKPIRQIVFETNAIGMISEEISQTLKVSIEGIGEKTYVYNQQNPTHKIVIDIPVDFANDIVIHLEMPNACKPFAVDRSNTDPRMLAVRFGDAHIYLAAATPALTGYQQHGLMRSRTTLPSELTKVSVAMGIDESLPFKLTGFSIAQTDHRWTEGTTASLTIPATQDNKPIRQIVFETNAIGMISEEISQTLKVSIEGIGEKTYVYNQQNPTHKIVIDIPVDFANDIVIHLEMPNACKPFAVDRSNTDPRMLAVRFGDAHIYFGNSSQPVCVP